MKKEHPSLPELIEQTRRTIPDETQTDPSSPEPSLAGRILAARRSTPLPSLPTVERWSFAGAALAAAVAIGCHFLIKPETEPAVSDLWMDLTEEQL